MAGLRKMKKYDWTDSNMAKFGSSDDRKVKKESAMTEPAWALVAKQTDNFMLIWRINQFKIELVPESEHGTFYNGDSYIICKGTKKEGKNKLLYNVHFWIGKYSTADEYGTAAYKTVELDTFLDDAAIQHREVGNFESDLFKSYFNGLTLLKGGHESGFRHVEAETYKPRLLHFERSGRQTIMRQVHFTKQSVNSGDVFLLDLGSNVYQFNGKTSSAFERQEAGRVRELLESERGKCKTEVFDEADIGPDNIFWTSLPDKPIKEQEKVPDVVKALYKVSDESGKLETTLVCEGSAPKGSIKPEDVYMIQDKHHLYVYVGSKVSATEKRNAFSNAQEFLKGRPNALTSITVVSEEQADAVLHDILD